MIDDDRDVKKNNFIFSIVKNKMNWTGNDGNNGMVQRQVTKDLLLLGMH